MLRHSTRPKFDPGESDAVSLQCWSNIGKMSCPQYFRLVEEEALGRSCMRTVELLALGELCVFYINEPQGNYHMLTRNFTYILF